MNILDISEDLLISVFDYLDLETKLETYVVCKSFQYILQSKYLAIRSFKVPLYNKRWSSVLNHPYLSARYLVKLDISGLKVQSVSTDMNREQFRIELKSAIIIFTNLKDLNIGYTDLTMPDCLEICPHLPNLVKLCVNFDWPSLKVEFTDDILMSYRQIFSNIEHLHFIGGKYVLLDTDVLMYMLESDRPKELRLTFIDVNNYDTRPSYIFDGVKHHYNETYPFKKLVIENCSHDYLDMKSKLLHYRELKCKFDLNITRFMGYTLHNYIPHYVWVTPNLLPVVNENGRVAQCSVITDSTTQEDFLGKCKIVLWHKDYYTERFHNKVKDYLLSELPVRVNARNVDAMKSYKGHSDTLYICNCVFKTNHISDIEQMFPDTSTIKKMVLGESICRCESSLPARFDGDLYKLTNLTYLCLNEFHFLHINLNDVLACCPNLETLIASAVGVARWGEHKINEEHITIDFLKYGKRLKHICFLFYEFDVNIALKRLSLCPTLETLIIRHHPRSMVTRESITNIVDKCPQLNYIAIPTIYYTHGSNPQRDIFNDVLRHRPNVEYRLLDTGGDYIINLPRERVFLLYDSFAAENVY